MAVREILKRNPMAGVIALVMHTAIILFVVVGFDWLEKPKPLKSNVEVVQARVVNEKLVAAEVEKLKQADEKKKAIQKKEQQKLADLKKKQAAEKKRLADLEKKRKAEEKKRKTAEKKRIAEEKKRKAAEAKRVAEEKKLKQAAEKRKAEEKKRKQAEAKRLAEEKKRKAAEAKKLADEKKRKEAEAKLLAEEKKRKAAEARKRAEEKKRKEAEARRLAEEKKRKAAEAAARKAREDELIAAMEAERNSREINRFIAQINQKVERNWLRPAGISDGLQATLRVRMAPGGAVIAVSVLKSSGVGAFDRSAAAAVHKADPLPVPSGKLFESFREINFVFDPN